MVDSEREPDWRDEAACALPENQPYEDTFFSEDPTDIQSARNLCFTCPVRLDCLSYALDNSIIHGVWGGADETGLRRALSVDAEGAEIRRSRYPQCLSCGARTSKLTVKVVDQPNGGRWTTTKAIVCTECEFTWRSRSGANAVDAYYAERRAKKARRELLIEKGKQLRLSED